MRKQFIKISIFFFLTACATSKINKPTTPRQVSKSCTDLKAKYSSLGILTEAFFNEAPEQEAIPNASLRMYQQQISAPWITVDRELRQRNLQFDQTIIATLGFWLNKACKAQIPNGWNYSPADLTFKFTSPDGTRKIVAGPEALRAVLSKISAWRKQQEVENSNLQAEMLEYSSIPLTKPFRKTLKFAFPNLSGKLKSEAQEIRKEIVQRKVLEEASRVPFAFASFNKEVDAKLSREIVDPRSAQYFPRNEYTDQLEVFDIHSISGAENPFSDLKWDPAAASQRFPFGPDDFEDEENSNQGIEKAQIADKEKRKKVLATLLLNHSKFETKKTDATSFEVSVVIDLPSFFRKCKFKPIKELIE